MREFLWRVIAWLCTCPVIMRTLMRVAMRRPYRAIDDYMGRWWLFNPYDRPGYVKWLPSVRLHHIKRPDNDLHLHDHPWAARSIILRGAYLEHRLVCADDSPLGYYVCQYHRYAGCTYALKATDFHSIVSTSSGGAWTLFITGRKVQTWGFLVDGRKAPYHEYLE
nr:hypothetical protein [uncultured Roseateles sp.]